MDVRRARGRPTLSASEPPPRARSPARKSPARRSPARRSPTRKSPARRSPTRKSPARRSPTRKSPARRSPTRKSPARKSPGRKTSARTKSPTGAQTEPSGGRATRKKPTATVTPTSPSKLPIALTKETKEKPENKSTTTLTSVTRTPISISPLKTDFKESSSIESVTSSSYHSSTRTTTKTKATIETVDFGSNQSLDKSGGDIEVSKLTSIASLIRRSVSKAATPLTELNRHSRSVSRSVYEDEDNYSKTEYSDNEQENFETVRGDLSQYAKKSAARQIEVPREFGGAIGASLFLLLVPVIVLYLQHCCNAQSCRFKYVNLRNTSLNSISNLFDKYVTGAYVSFISLVYLLSSFPFGRVVILPNDRGTVKYYFNSILTTLVISLGLGIAQYLGFSVGGFVWKNYFKFLVLSILFAFGTALCCYWKARKAASNALNPYAKTGNVITDFFLGREITPKWFGVVDIKLASYRICLIATFIFSAVFILKSLQFPVVQEEQTQLGYVDFAKYFLLNIQCDVPAFFSAALLAIYVTDLIFSEHHLASSFDLQQEGVGALLLLRYAVTPFLMAIVPRYFLLIKAVSTAKWEYLLISTVFLIGLVIKRASNSLKYQYRMNPQQPNLLLLDTVPTFQGRRLLLGRWWGKLRQPNYAGDILSLIGYVAPVALHFAWPPVLCILLIVSFIIHRAVRVNVRNSKRYDSAWARYCSKVRHILLPKVF